MVGATLMNGISNDDAQIVTGMVGKFADGVDSLVLKCLSITISFNVNLRRSLRGTHCVWPLSIKQANMLACHRATWGSTISRGNS